MEMKKARVAILISNKIDCKTKAITWSQHNTKEINLTRKHKPFKDMHPTQDHLNIKRKSWWTLRER